MIYFSGFCLRDESELFAEYYIDNLYTVVGFSKGAIDAFEFVYNSTKRIDRLILLSPAFFQAQKSSFVRTQLRYFDRGQDNYISQFISNVKYPSDINLSSYLEIGSKDELENLLSYEWDIDKLKEIKDRGIMIEVFLGSEDKIINSDKAFEFFSNNSVITYLIKKVGHILR